MGKQLLLYLFYALIPALVTSDFLIEQFRNIKKRSASHAHPGGIEVYWLKIDCKVTSRFAHNVITSRAVNRANVSKEAVFDVDLPKTAFITNFTMTIDGVSYPGVIKEKEAAQQQYQKAVSRGQSAGLVKASGRKTEKFTVKVNIAAASKVNFELTYEELFKRTFGKYELYLKINSKELINKFEIEANIYEPQGISYLDVEGTFLNNDLLPLVKKSFSGKKGHVLFSPTIDQQRSCENCTTSLLQGDFIIKYDVNRDSPSKLQIVNGYFVHFFAPKNLQHLPKNIAFVIDISGSMYGQKIKQTKEALARIVEDLKEEDHFNFILFHTSVSTWKDKLIKATPENVKEAKDFISKITHQGVTNLNDGLMTGIEMLNEAHASGSVPARSASLVIMLTDGQPTEGEIRRDVIQENIKNATQGRYPLYNLGFGYDVNYGFLERLAKENNGLARRIYEDSDADLQLQGFYDEVANPLLTEVALQYPENAVSDLTQNNFKHYYDGSEIVVAGRIADNDLKRMTAAVNAQGAENEVTFSDEADVDEADPSLDAQEYIFDQYVERLWAYLSVNQLLEERNVRTGGEKTNLTAKALDMALKYKFVTPLTSMVVTKPEDTENANETEIADKPQEAEARRAFNYQAPPSYPYYSSVDSDPHFIIAVPQKEDALCFNINEEPGIVLNLVRDPVTGIIINGKLIGDKTSSNDAGSQNTYFGTIGIVISPLDLRIEITTEEIILQNGRKQSTFKWLDDVIFRQQGFTLIIKPKKSIEISMDDGARFLVILHQVWRKHPLHRDFLGFYTLDSHRLSEQTHGLLGQFYHSIDFSILEVHPGIDPEKPDATMIVKNNQLMVTRGWQKDYRNDARHGINIPCWFIHNNGEGLIDGVHTDYIVPRIF